MKNLFTFLLIMSTVYSSYSQERDVNLYPTNDEVDFNVNGFFINGSLFTQNTRLVKRDSEHGAAFDRTIDQYGIGIRVGNKFHKKTNKKYSPGIKIAWLRLDFGLSYDFDFSAAIAPIHLGFSNLWKLSKTRSIEFNVNTGYVWNVNNGWYNSISVQSEVIFSYKKGVYGLGYEYNYGVRIGYRGNLNQHKVKLIIGIR
ncbi:MAG: hypothetical protein QNK23_11305 [Crocinitomicaceae bacterium]|nr:hypothetical protein [Crocinitomicaceae bacterium]